MAVSPAENRQEYAGDLASLEGWVEEAGSAEGLRAAEEELASLELERAELEARVSERRRPCQL